MDNKDREAYRAAFAEASSELKQIFGKIEELQMRRMRVEKVVEVLGKKIGDGEPQVPQQVRLKTHLPGLTVVTRLTAFESDRAAGN